MRKLAKIYLLGFLTSAPVYAEVVIPMTTPARQASMCPFLKLTEFNCSDQKPLPSELMDGDIGKSVWADTYSSADKCKLWWWAHYAQQWHYPPLSEWAQLFQDGLREGLTVSATAGYLRHPPKPPKILLDGTNVADPACRKPTSAEHRTLNHSLKHLSSQMISSDLLSQLLQFCMAFEVQVPPWKRLGTQLAHAYVIPIGSINLAVISELRHWDERALASLGTQQSQMDTVNNIVGQCPITDDPRTCLEGLLKPPDTGLFTQGEAPHIQKMEVKMKAAPEGTGLENLYAAHIKKPYDILLKVENGGDFQFIWKSPYGKMQLQVIAHEGELALSAPRPPCDSELNEEENIILRPLAYGAALENMAKTIITYDKNDFPAPNFKPLEGSKHACNEEPNYSQWAATVASAARHYALHGRPVDEIFNFIASQRASWNIDSEVTPPRSQKDVIYGAVRDKQLETPLFSKFGLDGQAMRFVAGNENQVGKSLLYRTTKIDGIPATEVWYYRNGVRIWPLDARSPRTNILVIHNNHAKELMSRSVFSRLNMLANNCAPIEEVRGAYIKAIYALYNAVPLQIGEEVVNRVFLAATYQAIFGEKFANLKSWGNVSADAWTMDLDTFAQKYLPLL